MTFTKTCKICGTTFQAKGNRAAYCSDECKKQVKADYDRKHYKANAEEKKLCVKEWKAANRDRVNELNRAAWADPERKQVMRARIERYVDANREACEERWAANTRRRIETGEHQALCGKRRRRIAVNTPEMTAAEQAKLAQFYRVARLLTKRYGIAFDVDHIIPLVKGGEHHPRNLQILTASENRSKGAKVPA